MINYIGDLSKKDAIVLRDYAENGLDILEFGSGASTQIFAAYGNSRIISLDTSKEWIQRTKENIKLIGSNNKVYFFDYADVYFNRTPIPYSSFDFIFVDGNGALRREFAFQYWLLLEVGGTMAFHDTRRERDIDNVMRLLAHYALEIKKVEFNKDNSNITIIEKGNRLEYEDWNVAEGKKKWQIGTGLEPVNMEEFNRLQNNSGKLT